MCSGQPLVPSVKTGRYLSMYITRQKAKEILSCYSWMFEKLEEFAKFTGESVEFFSKLEECKKAQDYLSENVNEWR